MNILKRLRLTTLRRKILLLAVGSELLILAAAAQLGITHLSRNQEQLAQAMANTLSYSTDRLDQVIGGIASLSQQLYSNDTIQNALAAALATDRDKEVSVSSHRIYQALTDALQQKHYPSIRYISVIADSFSTHSDSRIARQTPETVVQALCEEALQAEGKLRIRTEWSGEYGLFLVRSIRRIQPFDLRELGVLIICLDPDQLMSDTTLSSAFYGDMFFLLNDGDQPFYRSPALPADTEEAIHAQLEGQDYGVVSLGEAPYFVRRGEMSSYGWQYSCLVSYQEQQDSLHRAYLSLLGALALVMVAAAFLSSAVARSISRQYTALADKMRAFRGQQMSPVSPATAEPVDEVGLLHQQFDRMADEISTLIREKYVSELLTKEAQLQALEAQVNPHFLYNVLESIHWRAQAAQQKEICEIVDALGNFLHVSLNRRVKMISLRQELSLVENYIIIQRYRFEDRLQYSQQVPEELMDVSLPKLAIQPLVENAVKYAVETSLDDECQIMVEARKQGDELEITVRNSGSTMGEHLLEDLHNGAAQPHGLGIGLTNIDSRLRLTYGEDYGLQVFDEEDYAVCRMLIPMALHAPKPEGGKACSDC